MRFLTSMLAILAFAFSARGAEPLHVQIDKLIEAGAKGQRASSLTEDGVFLRRITLDLAGRIPTVAETRAFLADKAKDKRTRVIDRLLNDRDRYAARMAQRFNVMYMERVGTHAEWEKYLLESFRANKPWDRMAREILRADPEAKDARGASFFYSKRLEKFGTNPVDYPGLTRDVGRLFLGVDLQCAQCHNHVFIKDYKQADYQGLFAFFENMYLADAKTPAVAEKLTTKKVEFVSVFGQKKRVTGPRVPGLDEIAIPAFKKGEEYLVKPDRKKKVAGVPRFSPLVKLSEQLPTSDNPAFARNMANRLWYVLIGRGLIHPLDLAHDTNPPSHPELLDLLAKEFVAHKFDMKYLLREIALSQTYQRSSVLPEGQDRFEPARFLTAHEKRMSAEQMLDSMLIAAGVDAQVRKDKNGYAALEKRCLAAFANPPREPEEEFAPSLASALFVSNDDTVLGWLTPRDGNLVERLVKLPDGKVAEEAYLSILTRMPTADEQKTVDDYLARNKERRVQALGNLAWALLASTEFCVNH